MPLKNVSIYHAHYSLITNQFSILIRAPIKPAACTPSGRVIPRSVSLFPDSFPHIRLSLRSSGGVHVDIPIKVQIELFENRDQGFDVIVGRLPWIHREVTLEEDLFLGDVRDHQPV